MQGGEKIWIGRDLSGHEGEDNSGNEGCMGKFGMGVSNENGERIASLQKLNT